MENFRILFLEIKFKITTGIDVDDRKGFFLQNYRKTKVVKSRALYENFSCYNNDNSNKNQIQIFWGFWKNQNGWIIQANMVPYFFSPDNTQSAMTVKRWYRVFGPSENTYVLVAGFAMEYLPG